jgi:hypothetical protein
MKIMKIIGTGALVISTSAPAIATNPPLGRPTPPPCCADGICYPNATTWGWYETRWRRWPTEDLQPTPATGVGKPGQETPGIPSYETMSPELEDRKAPPPTKPRAEQEERSEAPRERPLAPAPDGESPPPRPSLTTPPGGLLTTPPESPLTPGGPAPFSPTPSTPQTSPLAPPSTNRMPWENGNEPTGDWDPPPTLPSAKAVTIDRASAPEAPNRFHPAPATQPMYRQRQAPNSDPPPAPPVALASASY